MEKLIILKNSLHKLCVCDNLSSLYILIMILNFVYSHVDEIYFPQTSDVCSNMYILYMYDVILKVAAINANVIKKINER